MCVLPVHASETLKVQLSVSAGSDLLWFEVVSQFLVVLSCAGWFVSNQLGTCLLLAQKMRMRETKILNGRSRLIRSRKRVSRKSVRAVYKQHLLSP